MKPSELRDYLGTLINNDLRMSAMIWGPPGVGKSSIVMQIAVQNALEFIDVRLSQLAPTDLRGLPVPEDGSTCWMPPDFLPTSGKGVLFLDEINMAPPAMQGVAQQLILDRRVGSYTVPDGWFVWAAGNRKEDHAAVFDMPGPLANRFVHLEVDPAAEDFRQYAYANAFHEHVISFVAFRDDLLHKIMQNENAWPSPRSWEMADRLYKAGLDIEPAVGPAPASEFYAFLEIIENTPDLDAIAQGKTSIAFPEEPSLRYASVMGLVGRCLQPDIAMHCFRWLVDKAPAEWVQLFATDLFPRLRERDQLTEVHQTMLGDKHLNAFLQEFTELMTA